MTGPLFEVVAEGVADEATVEITQAIPASQRIPLHAVVVGDSVFDTFGNTHRIQRLYCTRPGWLYIERCDRPRHFECIGHIDRDEITILPTWEGRRG